MLVTVVGSLSGSMRVQKRTVIRLLESKAERLTHHGLFTGKPGTRIYADGQYVLKINTGRQFPSVDVAKRWCQLQIGKEKQYRLYHPDRTWLALQMDGRCYVANITPRLQPLHQLDFTALESEACAALLARVAGCYLDFVCRFGQRLDEGLSNFALCGDAVIYLDDDIYSWDNFSAFTAMMAHWLRKSASLGMGTEQWRQFGGLLRPGLLRYSSEADDVVCAGLEDQFVGRSEAMKKTLINALRPGYAPTVDTARRALFRPGEAIGLLADVHGNLPALEAVLAEMGRRGVRQYLMLGDIVGYGPNPGACIDLLRQRHIYCLRGNHDHYVAHNGDVRVAMGIMAKRMADWTITQLDESERAWLGDLPVRYRSGNWVAVHGAPVDKSFFNAYVYEMTAERNLNYLAADGTQICLHGHSHIQGVYGLIDGGFLPFHCPHRVDMRGWDAALVCPGAIGQSRDGKQVAQAAIFDPSTLRIEMLSVDYDVELLVADMLRLDFPAALIARMREGR